MESVGVKPLVWERIEHGSETYFLAVSLLGRYRAYDYGWFISEGPTNGSGQVDGAEAAKLAAQADYESRILSALQPPPPASP